MDVGTEWLIDAQGCDAEKLRSVEALSALLQQVIADLRLNVVGAPHWHQFPGAGGVTGMILLSESHLTCHTFPEFGTATLNLYCCRSRAQWPWAEQLRLKLGATDVHVRTLERSGAGAPAHSGGGAE